MKTAPKSLTNGSVPISMLETGSIIKKMDLAFSITLMEISTKEDGKLTKGMAKVRTGLQTPRTN